MFLDSGVGRWQTQNLSIWNSHILYSNPYVFFFLFRDSNPRRWTATFGISTTLPKQIIRLKTILIHKNYNSITHENDIAVVQLDRDVSFTKNVHSVCLPVATQSISPGSTAYVTGWGSPRHGGKCLRKNKTKTTIKPGTCYYIIIFLIREHLKDRFYGQKHPIFLSA